MSKVTAIEAHSPPLVAEDRPDASIGDRKPYDEAAESDPDVIVYRISGALFFGAAASIGSVLDRIADTHRALVVDFSAVPFLDSTGANTIEGLVRKASRRGVVVYLAGTTGEQRRALFAHGIRPPLVRFKPSIADALKAARVKA